MRDKNFITTKVTDDIIMVQLEVNQTPKFSVDRFKKIIKYGEKNDYPEYLIYLYQNNPIHQAIVNTKAKYVAGTSIKAIDNPQADLWLTKANPMETWHEVDQKLALDEVTYNGFAILVRTNALGQPIQFYHMDFGKLRVSEDFDCVHYSDDWNARIVEQTNYPLWKEGIVGDSIYYYKQYAPSVNRIKGAYPLPEYVGASMDIDTDIEISSWCNNYTKNGFSATSLITIFGGEPKPEEKKNLAERLKTSHTGTSNAGKFVLAFAPKDGKAAEISSLQTGDLYQQFVEINKRNVQNIITGHQFTPVLAGIQTEGQMANSSGNDMAMAEDKFVNGYVNTKQIPLLNAKKKLYKAATNQVVEFEFEQVRIAGKELPIENSNIMGALSKDEVRKYINDTYGLGLVLAPIAPALPNGQAPQVTQQVEEHLTGLSASQNKDLQRIVRDYSKGTLNQAMAIDRICHYGISEEKAKKWLGIQMSIQMKAQDKFFAYLESQVIEIDENDEILETKFIGCHPVKMANENEPTNEDKNNILEALKGNPYLTDEELAKLLGLTTAVVASALGWLYAKKLISSGDGSYMPTEKAFNKETQLETEIYTVYKYGLRPDVSGSLISPTTRDFCKKMVALTSGNKRLTYEAINNKDNDMESEYGINNAWDYKGGFYNDGTETTPFCRHTWVGETRIRRKK